MSAPDGFDPKASMLPDPGAAAAPIHVMRGGGKKNTQPAINPSAVRVEFDENLVDPENERILAKYQLGPGGKVEHLFNDDVKQHFVKQIKSKLCNAGTGSEVIRHKDCWAVVQVTRELLKAQIQRGNTNIGVNMLNINNRNSNNNGNSLAPLSEQNRNDANSDNGDSLEEEPVQSFAETVRERHNEAHVGLVNCGATCYLNSALQLLSYIPEFIKGLEESAVGLTEDQTQKREQLLNVFKKLYSETNAISLRETGDLTIFGDILRELHKKPTEKDLKKLNEQQDAGEFIQLLFDRFHINTTKFKYNRSEKLECNDGQFEGTEEKKVINTEDLVLRLELPRETATLQELVDRLNNKRDIVDDVKDCKDGRNPQADKGSATKITTYTLDDTNRYLLILLTRFDLNGDKINVGITCNGNLTFLNKRYQLYGSVLHRGQSMRRGHYTFLKVNDDLRSGIFYDDNDVSPVDHVYTWNENGFSLNANSYIVVYKRTDVPDEIEDISSREMASVVQKYEGVLADVKAGRMTIRSLPNENLRLKLLLRRARSVNTPQKRRLQEIQAEFERLMGPRTVAEVLAQPLPGAVSNAEAQAEYNRMMSSLPGSVPDGAAVPAPSSAAPPAPPGPAPGPEPEQNSAVHIEDLSNMNSQSNSQAGSPAPRSASNASSASSVGNNLQLDMGSFQNNPSNFQEGHMRIHFNADENKRVSANARIGQYRTRISGRNAANLKRKYNSRKANLNRKVQSAKNELNRLQREEEAKRQANQQALNAARSAREEAKRKLKEAEETAKAVAKSKATAKQTLKQTTVTGTKTLAQKQEELRQAELAAGKSKTFSNRFKGLFKRGGNKTRRANRRGTSRRRRN